MFDILVKHLQFMIHLAIFDRHSPWVQFQSVNICWCWRQVYQGLREQERSLGAKLNITSRLYMPWPVFQSYVSYALLLADNVEIIFYPIRQNSNWNCLARSRIPRCPRTLAGVRRGVLCLSPLATSSPVLVIATIYHRESQIYSTTRGKNLFIHLTLLNPA